MRASKVTEALEDESLRRDFRAQMACEAEGAAAGLAGATRDDCPYPKGGRRWNHWVYGCETAAGEKNIIEEGTIQFCTTGHSPLVTEMSVEEAMKMGWWKPRYADPKTRPLFIEEPKKCE